MHYCILFLSLHSLPQHPMIKTSYWFLNKYLSKMYLILKGNYYYSEITNIWSWRWELYV